jgi:hypothetical protein
MMVTKQYASPIFFEKVRFSQFTSIGHDYTKDPIFENIAFGYYGLLNQLINGYEQNLDKVNLLKEKLASSKYVYSK